MKNVTIAPVNPGDIPSQDCVKAVRFRLRVLIDEKER